MWHLFVIASAQREMIHEKLKAAGIQTMIHYPVPPHQQKAYQEMNGFSFPRSEKIHSSVLSLPIGPHLTKFEVIEICKALKSMNCEK